MKVRPCPFCGEQPKLIAGSDKLTKIVCPTDSSCRGSKLLICYVSDDEKQALECWNRRSAVQSFSDTSEEIEANLQADIEAMDSDGYCFECGTNTPGGCGGRFMDTAGCLLANAK